LKQIKEHAWVDGFQGAVTVCDMHGKIVEMNARAAETFGRYGGAQLIGKNLRDCHPPKANAIIGRMLETGESNIYTIEKKGVRKLIYQSPWIEGGKRMGLVELSLEIPENMPHYIRD